MGVRGRGRGIPHTAPGQRSAALGYGREGGFKQLVKLVNVTTEELKLGLEYVQRVAQDQINVHLQHGREQQSSVITCLTGELPVK